MKFNKFGAFLAGVTLLVVPAAVFASSGPSAGGLEDRVRHEILMLPYYNVFDAISFRVDDGTVTLFGQVTHPVVKDDAERAVKHLEGVQTVKNEIEVLPLSPFDNQIRWAEYRAIYGFPALQRYQLGAVPQIHIIVKDGHVTLEGIVGSEQDKELAYMRASGVPNVFSVTNNLRVAS